MAIEVARYPTLADLQAVAKPTESGCLIWQRGKDSGGYGSIRSRDRTWRAHEVAWFLAGNERPDGYALHHLCHNRDCVNVEHLVCITKAEHWKITKTEDRFFEVKRVLALQRETCRRGHNDWYVNPNTGVRLCRECQREWNRKRRRERRR